ncbi:hypothetical protein MNBD_GAMMA11-2525 [hydrothermal vent metagenome]|uniref:Uncharacterized protein n=1 Tax=hydrothermal vent metagenome TaxID=652676 RepID=A0A3B0XAS7_9ZZZZ
MKKYKMRTLIVAALSVSLLTGFGFGDLAKDILPDTDKCKNASDPKKCRKNEKLKSAAKIAAVGVAAKLIYDMVISFKTEQTTSESKVISSYKKKHKTLPDNPVLTSYKSSLKPGEVVKAGKEVLIVSSLEVVAGKKNSKVKIQEKIAIYDSEDNKKLLKELVKDVNSKTGKSGAFKNEFKFTLPVGMPQGIYPIKTLVVIDKKNQKEVKNRMQLVLEINADDEYRIIALNNY